MLQLDSEIVPLGPEHLCILRVAHLPQASLSKDKGLTKANGLQTLCRTSANTTSFCMGRKPKARAFDVIRGHTCVWTAELAPMREKDC